MLSAATFKSIAVWKICRICLLDSKTDAVSMPDFRNAAACRKSHPSSVQRHNPICDLIPHLLLTLSNTKAVSVCMPRLYNWKNFFSKCKNLFVVTEGINSTLRTKENGNFSEPTIGSAPKRVYQSTH